MTANRVKLQGIKNEYIKNDVCIALNQIKSLIRTCRVYRHIGKTIETLLRIGLYFYYYYYIYGYSLDVFRKLRILGIYCILVKSGHQGILDTYPNLRTKRDSSRLLV